MNTKDYVQIAEVLKSARYIPTWEHREFIGRELIKWFLANNPNFDKQRFMDAAKLED